MSCASVEWVGVVGTGGSRIKRVGSTSGPTRRAPRTPQVRRLIRLVAVGDASAVVGFADRF